MFITAQTGRGEMGVSFRESCYLEKNKIFVPKIKVHFKRKLGRAKQLIDDKSRYSVV